MEINTPHFNAIAGQFLTEAKKCSKKRPMKPAKVTEHTQEREWPPFAASLCSPTTTWVCPVCGQWYQTIRQRDELPIHAKRRCAEQHIEDGCRAYTEQSANNVLSNK